MSRPRQCEARDITIFRRYLRKRERLYRTLLRKAEFVDNLYPGRYPRSRMPLRFQRMLAPIPRSAFFFYVPRSGNSPLCVVDEDEPSGRKSAAALSFLFPDR